MAEGTKRPRRSSNEIKAEKKVKYAEAIKKHEAAIAELNAKIADLDKPKEKKKTKAQQASELKKLALSLTAEQLEELLKAATEKANAE